MTRTTTMLSLALALALAGCSGPTTRLLPTSTPLAAQAHPGQVSPTPPAAPQAVEPHTLISQDSLFAALADLTAIQAHSGWRNSATEGEAEALDYVARQLEQLAHLRSLGMEVERQGFRVFMSTESWDNQLYVSVDGQAVRVPAGNLRGQRDTIARALRFDSDGALNDTQRNPLEAHGHIYLIRSESDIDTLQPGQVAFVEYALVDTVLVGKEQAASILSSLLTHKPAGLVLVTQFSNKPHESHGSFVGEGSAFDLVEDSWMPPTLYTRLEDLAQAGISSWDDLARVESARLVWDADVLAPATSGNLVARIPGADPAQAVILGAHIDSPNNPGALDDGSGSVVLLEVARVIDAAQVHPATDIILVWFGSEELGVYGSDHFVLTHQELLDRTLAMLQIDMLSHPLDGIQATLDLVTWSYGRFDDGRLTWPDYLAGRASQWGVETNPVNYYGLESDNTAFAGFGVPNANLVYKNDYEMGRLGSIHYACHIHDPYDTVELAREGGDVLEDMARVALAAALETGQDKPDLRVSPRAEHRALFVASHTEAVHMAPTAFTDFGMALDINGFDVDLLPYGQAVSLADLEQTDLVVVLPVVDYPSPDGDASLYDEAWSQAEIAALETYVARGGLLVLTNSAHRLKYGNMVLDPNEDWADANALAARFGVTYQEEPLPGDMAQVEGYHPLIKGLTRLRLVEDNGLPFVLDDGKQGQALATAGEALVAALLDYGEAGGQVLVLADVGMLGSAWDRPANLAFWQRLADYARSRQDERP